MYFLLARLRYSPQAGPWVQMQHNVCSPTPAELQCTVISQPPAAGHCCGLRVLQTEGREMWNWSWIVIASQTLFHTLQLCNLDTAEWAQSRSTSHTQRLVSVDQLTGDEMGPQWHLLALCCHCEVRCGLWASGFVLATLASTHICPLRKKTASKLTDLGLKLAI